MSFYPNNFTRLTKFAKKTASFISSICLVSNLAWSSESTSPHPKFESFLSKHCYECHDDEVNKGDLNLYDLEFNPNDPKNFMMWESIYDRINENEMPPKKKKQPEAASKKAFLDQLKKPLIAANTKQKVEKGRVQMRRLTRSEYEYTIHDLLGIDIPLVDHLPEDPASHGFETVAAVQQISHFTMKNYLDVADQSLKHAFERAFEKEKKFSKSYSAEQLTSRKGGGNFRGPQKIGNYSVAWPHNLQFYGRMMLTRVPEDGWYEITLKDLHAKNPKNGVVWGTLKSGACASNAPILYMIGLVEATAEKRDVTYRAWIKQRHALELKANDNTYKRAKSTGKGGNIDYKNTDNLKNGIQGIAVSGIEIKRIYPNATAQQLRKNLLGPVDLNKLKASLSQPEEYKELLRQAIQSFASKAFRRPTYGSQLRPYLDLAFRAMKEKKNDVFDPLYIAYRAILCSPRFLTFIEKPGQLDQYAIASRLSYMLWNSLPDWPLLKAAKDKQLNDPKILKAQAERMLKHPKADRFIESFTDQWLSLNDINDTVPDRRLFRTFDGIVQESMLLETRAFFKEMIQKDLPIKNIMRSNFNMLNERLARHYKINNSEIKPGQGIQKVSVAKQDRSGLVTHGSLMKVTANGTTTSPILRGVWMSEKILGLHIPSPPTNVPAIEPDIRGAVSIRDQMAKHSSNESCASCHAKIDPTGLAFENFDPAGVWRSKYGTKKSSPKVDPSGITPDGKKFTHIDEWKTHYANKPDMLSKTFTKQLVTYSTGAVPGFSDRYPIKKIVDNAAKQNYGLKSLLLSTITSPLFSSK